MHVHAHAHDMCMVAQPARAASPPLALPGPCGVMCIAMQGMQGAPRPHAPRSRLPAAAARAGPPGGLAGGCAASKPTACTRRDTPCCCYCRAESGPPWQKTKAVGGKVPQYSSRPAPGPAATAPAAPAPVATAVPALFQQSTPPACQLRASCACARPPATNAAALSLHWASSMPPMWPRNLISDDLAHAYASARESTVRTWAAGHCTLAA